MSAFFQVIVVDLVLAGDNAIVVGMVAAGLPMRDRKKVIIIGIAAATLMRVGFALVTVQLLQIVGLLFAGGLLLLWVCWKLWREIEFQRKGGAGYDPEKTLQDGAERTTLRAAVIQIVIADVSMSLDNVLAVAGVARDHAWVLVFGLVLSVALMGIGATYIARLLDRYHWIAYIGLILIFYVAGAMIWDGSIELMAHAREG